MTDHIQAMIDAANNDDEPVAANLSEQLTKRLAKPMTTKPETKAAVETTKAKRATKSTTKKNTTKKAATKSAKATTPKKNAKATNATTTRAKAATKKAATKAAADVDISTRAMLVELNIHRWNGIKRRNDVRDELADNKRADHKGVRVDVQVVSDAFLKPIREILGQARRFHYANTLPWSDDGPRVLAVVRYERYRDAMNEFHTRYERAIESTARKLKKEKEARRAEMTGLGQLFDETLYPTPQQLRNMHKFTYRVTPLPSAADFRASLAADEIDRVRKDIESQLIDSMKLAHDEIVRRIHKYVKRLLDRLTADKVVITNSLIDTVRAMIDDLTELNFDDDATINALIDDLKPIAAYEPEMLRTNDETRKEAETQANKLMADLTAFMS